MTGPGKTSPLDQVVGLKDSSESKFPSYAMLPPPPMRTSVHFTFLLSVLLNTGNKEGAESSFSAALEGAKKLTAEEWGMSYPGNDPSAWSDGLEEFRAAIQANLNITSL